MTHGQTRGHAQTRLYRIWSCMKTRVKNPNRAQYKNYGGNRITVCGEWKNDFSAFRDWAIKNGYRDDLTIDRIDVEALSGRSETASGYHWKYVDDKKGVVQ